MAMEKWHVAIILAILIGISGCVQQEKEKEIVAGEPNATVDQPKEPEVVVEEAPKIPTLANEIQIGPGRASSLAGFGSLYVAYQRFTGESDDIYYAIYSDGKLSKPEKATDASVDEINANLAVSNGKLYLFYTSAASGAQISSEINFKEFSGQKWLAEKSGPEISVVLYPHNQTVLQHNKKLLLFWTRGRPNAQGAIGTQYYDGETWLDGIKVTAENVNEKNAKVAGSEDWIHLVYEGYAGNAENNEVYYRYYNGVAWSGAESLTGSINADFFGSGGVAEFNGKVYAIWFTRGGIYLSIKEGRIWSDPIKLEVAGVVDEPTIAEYNGKLFVSYTKITENGAPFVYLAELQGV